MLAWNYVCWMIWALKITFLLLTPSEPTPQKHKVPVNPVFAELPEVIDPHLLLRTPPLSQRPVVGSDFWGGQGAIGGIQPTERLQHPLWRALADRFQILRTFLTCFDMSSHPRSTILIHFLCVCVCVMLGFVVTTVVGISQIHGNVSCAV